MMYLRMDIRCEQGINTSKWLQYDLDTIFNVSTLASGHQSPIKLEIDQYLVVDASSHQAAFNCHQLMSPALHQH